MWSVSLQMLKSYVFLILYKTQPKVKLQLAEASSALALLRLALFLINPSTGVIIFQVKITIFKQS